MFLTRVIFRKIDMLVIPSRNFGDPAPKLPNVMSATKTRATASRVPAVRVDAKAGRLDEAIGHHPGMQSLASKSS